jgi:hypothetical protein
MPEVKRRRRRAAPPGIAPSEPERDILDQYLYEVSTYPLLKPVEEIALARRIRSGDQDALQELVKRNLRFVISVAKKYQNRGLVLDPFCGSGTTSTVARALGRRSITIEYSKVNAASAWERITNVGVIKREDADKPQSTAIFKNRRKGTKTVQVT